MRLWNRRSVLAGLAGFVPFAAVRSAAALSAAQASFVAQAFAMKQRAIESGDQPFGAVVVRGNEIVGLGPSRVLLRGEWVGHAEREAMRDAQAKLGRIDLSDCVMYSTSPPCSACQKVAAQARLARMYAGAGAVDLGPPRRLR